MINTLNYTVPWEHCGHCWLLDFLSITLMSPCLSKSPCLKLIHLSEWFAFEKIAIYAEMSQPFLIQIWVIASTKSNTEIPLYCLKYLPSTHILHTSPVPRPPLTSWYLPRCMNIFRCPYSLKAEQSFQLLLQKMQRTKLIDYFKIKKKKFREGKQHFLLYLLYIFSNYITAVFFKYFIYKIPK